jgi:hypothetical protein
MLANAVTLVVIASKSLLVSLLVIDGGKHCVKFFKAIHPSLDGRFGFGFGFICFSIVDDGRVAKVNELLLGESLIGESALYEGEVR